jgi:hypothetical protein
MALFLQHPWDMKFISVASETQETLILCHCVASETEQLSPIYLPQR